jgi:hypothetical protein
MDRPPFGLLFRRRILASGSAWSVRPRLEISRRSEVQGQRHQRCLATRVAWDGEASRAAVNPSRGPARTNRVHRATVSSTRFDSSIADFDSRHRALSSRWRELGNGSMRGFARRTPRADPGLKGMW